MPCARPARPARSSALPGRRAALRALLPLPALAAALLPGLARAQPAGPRLLRLRDGTPAPVADPRHGEITFIGTATVLLRWAGITLLTDPNFLHRGELADLGYGLKSPRLTDPAMRLEDLPPLDAVLLSHYHGDHFDARVEERLDRMLPIVSTRHAAGELRERGFQALHALQTWESITLAKGEARLRITAMPGRHGPPVAGRALPPVMGSLLEFMPDGGEVAYRLYVSGDTTMVDELKEIPRRYPQVDLALLHLGGTRLFGVLVTMDARQGVQMLRLVQPRRAIPIHNDDYAVFGSPLQDFLAAAERAGWKDRVQALQRGERHAFALHGLPR